MGMYFCSREKTIKDLLARSADKLDDWVVRGLVGSLKLPMTWIDEAKVCFVKRRFNTILTLCFRPGHVRI